MAVTRSRTGRIPTRRITHDDDRAPLSHDGDQKRGVSSSSTSSSSLKGDRGSIALLLLLYTLQGVPMGLSASVSFILQEKGATYAEQGIFSLASWPFSLKILWAPLVDALYVRSIGQRRTWLIPLQCVVGATLLWTAENVGALISDEGSDVRTLAGVFFWIYALLASQDIAVDGWALTMLSRENVGLASTCNSVGQTAGFFVSFTGFLVLNSYGSVGLKGFITFWGFVFLSSAVFVFLKKEKPVKPGAVEGVVDSYRQAVSIARLPAVLKLCGVLVTRAIAFSAAETITTLKLLERGVPKQHMASISAMMTPVSLCLPLIVARWTGGPRPLDVVVKTWMFRAVAALGASAVVLFVPAGVGDANAAIPWAYYACVFAWTSVYAGLNTIHFVSFMSFYSRVSDADMGGTYRTLLNTVSNLGYKWVETSTMFIIDAVSEKRCEGLRGKAAAVAAAAAMDKATCLAKGGRFVSGDRAFHLAVLATPFIAYAWLKLARAHINSLQSGSMGKWKVRVRN
jgi:PAT family acetyl-CoA transporter-like MFS transporter 1